MRARSSPKSKPDNTNRWKTMKAIIYSFPAFGIHWSAGRAFCSKRMACGETPQRALQALASEHQREMYQGKLWGDFQGAPEVTRAAFLPPARICLFSALSIRFSVQHENRIGSTIFKYQQWEFSLYLHANKQLLMLVLISRIPLACRCFFQGSPGEGSHLQMNIFAFIMLLFCHYILTFISWRLCIIPRVACRVLHIVVYLVPALTRLKTPWLLPVLLYGNCFFNQTDHQHWGHDVSIFENYLVWSRWVSIKIRAC